MAELLPRVGFDLARSAPADPRTLFERPCREVWLEIGFGGAEHLVWQAERNPDIGLIGCEPFEDGVVKALGWLSDRGLGNVLIHADDARPLLRWLPAGGIARAFVLFPDPWPKKRHRKRRLLSPATVAELARVLAPGAELRFASDIGDYVATALDSILGSGGFAWTARGPSDWRQRPAGWPETRYEAKAAAAGRTRYYFTFVRIH